MASAETLVVGGSAAGLAVARCLEERGRDVVILEREADVGTTWRHAYERLHLHTPRARSGLPFLNMPAAYPRYPSRQQVVDYLDLYASRLKHPPRFGENVSSVRRDGGHWVVATPATTYAAANVVIATGNSRVPFSAAIAGAERFAGTLLHSSAYHSGRDFAGQRVLVVGFGNSAAEIAIDLDEQGAVPTIAVRGAVNVIPREILGIPVASLGLVQKLFSAEIADRINEPLCRAIVGDIEQAGLRKLPYGPAVQIRDHHQIPVIDIGTMALIRAGRITVRPGVDHLTERGAIFADGSSDAFDAVILATGYRARVTDLLGDSPHLLDAGGTPTTSGEPTAAPGLYFCGFRIVAGGTLHEIASEARRIAELIAG